MMSTIQKLCAAAALAFAAAGCAGGGRDVFVPQSDYGIPPESNEYSEPGDCEGGSRLAAVSLDEPEYPRRAFRNGVQGWVVVRLDVGADGRTSNVEIVESQPTNAFNREARRTVRNWVFEPPGEPGLERCVVVLDFRLGQARIGL